MLEECGGTISVSSLTAANKTCTGRGRACGRALPPGFPEHDGEDDDDDDDDDDDEEEEEEDNEVEQFIYAKSTIPKFELGPALSIIVSFLLPDM